MLQILLVDDEPYVVDDLAITIPWDDLQFEQVHKAYSGKEALEILKHNPIDIVITDISMPEMSGLQLIEHIRSDWKHVKCVLLTGYAEFSYAKKAIDLQASDYLLKPFKDEDFIEILRRLQNQIQIEWEALSSYQRSMQTFREHLPLLHDKLLNELLQGRRFSNTALSEQMQKYELPFMIDEHAALLVMRLEDYFQRQDTNSILLFEYAIVNIAGELFQERFAIWSCKDVHDYLVFLLQPKIPGAGTIEEIHEQLIQTAYQLQRNVNTYLGGGISVVTTNQGTFPNQIHGLYQSAISIIRQRIGQETGIFLTADQESAIPDVHTLQSLYEPPTLLHLLEANRWEAIDEKLNAILEELKLAKAYSQEHIQEAKHYLETAFYYIAHKNNKLLQDIVGSAVAESRIFHTPDMLRNWAVSVIHRLKESFETEHKDLRSILIKQVHDYVDQNLHYVSLQSIADHVKLHPVYLSKIYKSETGKSISDYLFQAKMEKAVYLLTHSQLKIYEISPLLGYSNAHYFIKLFKEFRGYTPQEYRDRSKWNGQE